MPFFSRGGGRQSAEKSRAKSPPQATPSDTEAAPSQADSTPASVLPPDPHVWRQEVALAAYYRWLERGAPDGDGQQDWYEAEAQLRGTAPRSRPS